MRAAELALRPGISPLYDVDDHRIRSAVRSCCLSHMDVTATRDGGARRDRTDDLMLAKHALSQLSYGPTLFLALRMPTSIRAITRASDAHQSIRAKRSHFGCPQGAPCETFTLRMPKDPCREVGGGIGRRPARIAPSASETPDNGGPGKI